MLIRNRGTEPIVTAFGVRTAWENRIQRYWETAEVRAEEFGSHLDDVILKDG